MDKPIKKGVNFLQVMSMNRNGEWNWFTIDGDLRESALQECIQKRLPYRTVIRDEKSELIKLIEERKTLLIKTDSRAFFDVIQELGYLLTQINKTT